MALKTNILDLVMQTHWAITPEKLEKIYQVALNHSVNPDIKISSDFVKPEAYAHEINGFRLEETYDVWVRDGVAIIPLFGVIAKRMNMFMYFSGGVSTEILAADFIKALESKQVEAILLNTDTPGGTVDGTKAVADIIYQARGKKPIICFANGQMTSGGTWIGTAADEIVAEETAVLGSIGVISIHEEYSEADKKEGVKRTVITAGKYKGIANSYEPLTSEGKQYVQERLDYLYGIFGAEVATHRGIEKEKVFKDMAEGKIFIGKQALDIGLIDKIGSFDDAFNLAKLRASENKTTIKKGGEKVMTLEELKIKDSAAYETLMREAKASVSTDVKAQFENEKTQIINAHATEVKELRTQIQVKDSKIQEADGRISALEKRESIRTEKEISDRADDIFTAKLEASDIPERLYPKVRNQVSYSKFVSADGVFDANAFKAAIDAEILDWPTDTNKQKVLGGVGGSSRTVLAGDAEVDEKAEDSLVDKMIGLAGGNDKIN